jgi:MinD-like ATPase involved in chromosome partitioning or flagellar assembly
VSKIISIHSFRGGTGKSNTCANLAAQLAVGGARVAIVDADIQSPGIHVLFGLNKGNMGHTLNEYLRGEVAIQDVAFSVGEHATDEPGCKQLAGKTIWLIPSSISSQEISRILKDGYDVNVLNRGLQTLLKELKLDYLLIDTHPGLNEETLLSIIISDVLVVLLRPDQQDYQGTAVTVDIAKSMDVPNLFLMVNKALTRYDFKQVQQAIEGAFECPVAAVLPLTEDMADLESRDVFSLRYPDHPWSRALKQAALKIVSVK